MAAQVELPRPSRPSRREWVVLEGFFQSLEARWAQLPPSEYASLGILERSRAEAAVRLPGPWSMYRLREVLRASLVRSPLQNEAFELAFIDCFGSLSQGELHREFQAPPSLEALERTLAPRWQPRGLQAPGAPQDPEPLIQNVRVSPPPSMWLRARHGLERLLQVGRQRLRRRWPWVLWPLLVLLGLGAALYPLVNRPPAPQNPEIFPAKPPVPPSQPEWSGTLKSWAEQTPLPPGFKALPIFLPGSLPFWHYVWRYVALSLGGVVLIAFAWASRIRWQRRWDTSVAENVSAHQPFSPRPQREDGPESLLSPEELDGLAMAITHTMGPAQRPRIDAQASVKATARRGGFPTVVLQEERRLRQVLVLTDLGTEALRERPVDVELAEGLERRGVPVERARWSGTLARVLPDGTSVAEELKAHAPERVILLIVSDGRGLFSWKAEARRLARFPYKVWIDPRDPASWGPQTLRRAEQVPMIAPDTEGWSRLRRLLGNEQPSQPDPAREAPLLGMEARDPGLAGEERAFSALEVRRLEALLGPALPWVCALAVYPLPMPVWYAQRIRRELESWALGPEAQSHPGASASLRSLSPLSLDRLRALPGVKISAGELRLDGPLARFLVRQVLHARWPGLYRRALALHEAMLESSQPPPHTQAELERQAALALVRWQLALCAWNDARPDARREAKQRLEAAAEVLRSLQRSRMQDWAHAFLRPAVGSDGKRNEPFLPMPRLRDIPRRLRPLLRSAIDGADPSPLNLVTALVAYFALIAMATLLLVAELGLPPGRVVLAQDQSSEIEVLDAAWWVKEGTWVKVRTLRGVSLLPLMPTNESKARGSGLPRHGEQLVLTLTVDPQSESRSCVDTWTHEGLIVLRCAPRVAGIQGVNDGNFPAISVALATRAQLEHPRSLAMAQRLLMSHSVDMVIEVPPGEKLLGPRLRAIIEQEFLGKLSADGSLLIVNRRNLWSYLPSGTRASSLRWNAQEALAVQLISLPANIPGMFSEIVWSRNSRPTSVISTPPPRDQIRDQDPPEQRTPEDETPPLNLRSYPLAKVPIKCIDKFGNRATCAVRGWFMDVEKDSSREFDLWVIANASYFVAKGPWHFEATCGLNRQPLVETWNGQVPSDREISFICPAEKPPAAAQ